MIFYKKKIETREIEKEEEKKRIADSLYKLSLNNNYTK